MESSAIEHASRGPNEKFVKIRMIKTKIQKRNKTQSQTQTQTKSHSNPFLAIPFHSTASIGGCIGLLHTSVGLSHFNNDSFIITNTDY